MKTIATIYAAIFLIALHGFGLAIEVVNDLPSGYWIVFSAGMGALIALLFWIIKRLED